MNGRRNPAECARVLRREGALIIAIPAPDDMIELRAAVLGEGVERDRVDALVTEHASLFDVVQRASVRQRHHVEAGMLADLLKTTYRGARRSEAAAAESLTAMDVTFASDIVVFRTK